MYEVSGRLIESTPEPFIVPVYGPSCAAVISVPFQIGGCEFPAGGTNVTMYVPFAQTIVSLSVMVAVTAEVCANVLKGEKNSKSRINRRCFIIALHFLLPCAYGNRYLAMRDRRENNSVDPQERSKCPKLSDVRADNGLNNLLPIQISNEQRVADRRVIAPNDIRDLDARERGDRRGSI